MKVDRTIAVHDYRLDFDPEVDSPKVRHDLIRKVADMFSGASGRPVYLYDGWHNLKSVIALEDKEYVTTLTVRNEQSKCKDQKIIFRRAENVINYGSMEMMRLYNQLSRNSMLVHLKWMRIFHHFYNPATVRTITTTSCDIKLVQRIRHGDKCLRR